MTDKNFEKDINVPSKQIIIDGVVVSECEYFKVTLPIECSGKYRCNCDSIHTMSLNCEDNNCIYKQFKRKEQECEELKKIIDEAKNSKLDLKSFLVGEAIQNEYEQQLDQLKAENEELKNFHINLVGVKECEIKELLKLKQTLAVIKEIAEKSCCTQPTTTCEEYDNCQECGRISDAEAVQQILQKISEVINEN